ncbi:hypothetical protein [Saccharothrix luteola]|uniref:hypothetical protein n=1 Tax=Saccharothrix luteola TaxID=2893018 RepID=UPI001E608608|nr:hypothetical protein [Saccharothrix luteola]MCC8245050.1 hypothetical protein [Saccharothrix luteola]
MSRHRQGRAVLSLLIRMGWQHDPASWTVRCKDRNGRRARLAIHVATTGISIDGIHTDQLVLTPLQVGRLRAALRQALLAYDRLAGSDTQPERTVAAPPTPAAPPNRIRVRPAARPTVSAIRARLAAPTTPDVQEVSDEQLRTRPRRFAA